MYCEKCGKMNAEGAIFCSNCSTILRSRRQSNPAPADATKRFSVPEHTEKKEIPVAVKERPVPKAEEERPVKREMPENPVKNQETKEYIKPDFDERLYDEQAKKGSAWLGVLAAMSWLVFVAFAAVGIVCGGWLLLMGLSEKQAILSFGGGAVLILCFVVGLTFLSKNMIYINMAKTINQLKNRK